MENHRKVSLWIFLLFSIIDLIHLLSLLRRIFSIQSSKLQSILSVDRHSLGRDILDCVFLADSRSLWRDFLNYDSPFADPNGWYGSESDPSGFPSGISLQIAEIERRPFSGILVQKNGTSDAQIQKGRPLFVANYPQTLPKAQRTRGLSSSCQSHIASSNTNLDQISSSES